MRRPDTVIGLSLGLSLGLSPGHPGREESTWLI